MTTTWHAAVVLAALELTPGEPSDLTALLRDPQQRSALLDPSGPRTAPQDRGYDDPEHDRASDLTSLGDYLAAALDPRRVEHWSKVLEGGIAAGAYAPLIVGEGRYAHRLADLWDAPPVLFHSIGEQGAAQKPKREVAALDPPGAAVAIVGGRDAGDEVLAATHRVAGALAATGIRIVSGLAAGVDTAAHRGALSGGGLTTAVLGTGLDHVYPDENRELAAAIRERGFLVSQFAPPAPRTGTTFLRRNAVIAGLSDVSLIMDGRVRSGSRHELECAIRYGRGALLWAPALAREPWACATAESGRASFVESANDVLAHLG